MNNSLICVGCGQPLRETGVGISILSGPGIECKVCKTQYLADFIVREGSSKPVLVLQPLPPDWEQRYDELQKQYGPSSPPGQKEFSTENDPYNNGFTPQDFENGLMPNAFPGSRQVNPNFNQKRPHSSSKLVGKERSIEEIKNLVKESLTPSELVKRLSSAE